MYPAKKISAEEIKKIKSAANVVKKYAKYVEDVTSMNELLERNLAEAIKAGDVTNEQKVILRRYADACEQSRLLFEKVTSQCRPGCECVGGDYADCELHNELVVLNAMGGVVNGSSFDWGNVFMWASAGRWEWLKQHGYRKENHDE